MYFASFFLSKFSPFNFIFYLEFCTVCCENPMHEIVAFHNHKFNTNGNIFHSKNKLSFCVFIRDLNTLMFLCKHFWMKDNCILVGGWFFIREFIFGLCFSTPWHFFRAINYVWQRLNELSVAYALHANSIFLFNPFFLQTWKLFSSGFHSSSDLFLRMQMFFRRENIFNYGKSVRHRFYPLISIRIPFNVFELGKNQALLVIVFHSVNMCFCCTDCLKNCIIDENYMETRLRQPS